MKKFWSSIEEVPGQATAHVEWRDRLGNEWPLVNAFLRSTGRSASSAVLPSPGGARDIFRIVRHASGQIVGISDEGDRYPLKKGDDAIYELNRTVFISAICKALQLEVVSEGDGVGSDVKRIGTYLVGGTRHPAFLVLTSENNAFESAVMQALASVDVLSCLIFTPTPRRISGSIQRQFGTRRCCLLALSDILALAKNDQFICVRRPQDIQLQAHNVAAGVEPRKDGVYAPNTVVWHEQEYLCDLSRREMKFLELGLASNSVEVATLMHRRKGLLWKEHFLNTKDSRDKVSLFLSRLNTKLLNAAPPLSISFSLKRGTDTVIRATSDGRSASNSLS